MWKITHWMHWTRIYKCWDSMKQRCNNTKQKLYHRYGWRWITYDPKWKTFEWFYEDMKDWYKEHLTLDRINNELNYSKSNCAWETMLKQNRNTSRNHYYKWKCISEWCYVLLLNRNTVWTRIRRSWTIKKALEL